MSEERTPSLLTPEDVRAMRAHLEQNPPLIGPPPDRPYWDVRRIVVTLERAQAQDAALKRIAEEAPTLDEVRDLQWNADPGDADDAYNLGTHITHRAIANIAQEALEWKP